MGQMKEVKTLLDGEFNTLVIERLSKDNYTKDAITSLKGTLNRLNAFVNKRCMRTGLQRMGAIFRLDRRRTMLADINLSRKYLAHIQNGGELEKVHMKTSASRVEFFKIIEGKILKWCRSKDNINKPNSGKSFDLAKIRGVVYGKVTDPFIRKSSETYENWLCMSIILEDRPFDFVCKEENVNQWYNGLAFVIKKRNPKAIVLSVGKFFWRKLRFLLTALVLITIKTDKRKLDLRKLTFCKAIINYSKLKLHR